MKFAYILVIPLLLISFLGCASNVYVQHPHPDSSGGRIIIKFTSAMDNVNIKIDGSLVVNEANTQRILINHVPADTVFVEISASSDSRTAPISLTKRVVIREGETEIILVSTPPYSTGYQIVSMVLGIMIGSALGSLIFQ